MRDGGARNHEGVSRAHREEQRCGAAWQDAAARVGDERIDRVQVTRRGGDHAFHDRADGLALDNRADGLAAANAADRVGCGVGRHAELQSVLYGDQRSAGRREGPRVHKSPGDEPRERRANHGVGAHRSELLRCGAGGANAGLCPGEPSLRPVELRLRGGTVRIECAHAARLGRRLAMLRLRVGDRCGDLTLPGYEVTRVDANERLAAADDVAFLDQHGDDGAHQLSAQRGLTKRRRCTGCLERAVHHRVLHGVHGARHFDRVCLRGFR